MRIICEQSGRRPPGENESCRVRRGRHVLSRYGWVSNALTAEHLHAQSKFEVFTREMTAHLDEEETDLVPVMRQKFTQQEERKVGAFLSSITDGVDPPEATASRAGEAELHRPQSVSFPSGACFKASHGFPVPTKHALLTDDPDMR